jgi:hypothetical protein
MSHFVVAGRLLLWVDVGMLHTLLAVLHLALLPPSTRPAPGAALPLAGEAGMTGRFETPTGPVRVFTPPGYDPTTAATVVYVHGYHRHADSVWAVGDLENQFAASARNALFIVPTAAESDGAPLRWARLGGLFEHLAGRGVARPAGPLILVGHSGAYRTIARWVASDRGAISAVILLDALYGGHAAFEQYARRGRLAVVTHSTAPQAARFLMRLPSVVRRAEAPPEGVFTEAERSAQVLALDTRLGHAALNDSGAFLPALLGLYAPRAATAAVDTNGVGVLTAAR